MDPILKLLEKNAKLSPEEIADAIGKDVDTVKKAIRKYEKSGVIVKYKAVLNKDLIEDDSKEVIALIEVKVVPQKNAGFDHVASRIYKFPEVVSCYLVSGTYDLLLVVQGKDLQTIARFVAEKLAPMDHVGGTTTHFLLKKYKEDGDILVKKRKDIRQAITL